MSKHARVNGKLLQLNKTYNNLKNKQKEKIAHWMVEETEMFYEKTGAFPTDSDEFTIVDNVYARIEAAEIWIPYDEIAIRYSKKRESICCSVRKSEILNAHLHQQTAMVTMCLVCHNDKVLVVEKIRRKRPVITFPGGDVEPHESFFDAVVRNVFEQTGILIKNPAMQGIFHWQQEGVHHVYLLYRADHFSGSLKNTSAYWISRQELEQKDLSLGMWQMLRVMDTPYFSERFMIVED